MNEMRPLQSQGDAMLMSVFNVTSEYTPLFQAPWDIPTSNYGGTLTGMDTRVSTQGR